MASTDLPSAQEAARNQASFEEAAASDGGAFVFDIFFLRRWIEAALRWGTPGLRYSHHDETVASSLWWLARAVEHSWVGCESFRHLPGVNIAQLSEGLHRFRYLTPHSDELLTAPPLNGDLRRFRSLLPFEPEDVARIHNAYTGHGGLYPPAEFHRGLEEEGGHAVEFLAMWSDWLVSCCCTLAMPESDCRVHRFLTDTAPIEEAWSLRPAP